MNRLFWKPIAFFLGWRASSDVEDRRDRGLITLRRGRATVRRGLITIHNTRDIYYHNANGDMWRVAVMDSIRYILKTGEYKK